MKIHIPEIGTAFRLTQDWTFELHHEHRNSSLHKFYDPQYTYDWRSEKAPTQITLPIGTVLTVDRIYIRKNASGYSSITFNCNQVGDTKIKPIRFWAKLDAVNQIECEISNENAQVTLAWSDYYLKRWSTAGLVLPYYFIMDDQSIIVNPPHKADDICNLPSGAEFKCTVKGNVKVQNSSEPKLLMETNLMIVVEIKTSTFYGTNVTYRIKSNDGFRITKPTGELIFESDKYNPALQKKIREYIKKNQN